MEVDFLQEDDIDSLLFLIRDTFNIPICLDESKSLLGKNPRFLCAKDKSVLVGTVMITTKYDPFLDRKVFYLDYVSVLKEYQHKGIGTLLMKKVEALARLEKVSRIEFTSNRKRVYARKMYESLGYKEKDTSFYYKEVD